MKSKPPDPKAQARRAALNALRRARRAAARSGVALSDWEGEFLGSVEQRVETFGRAFADPEKGAPGHALSGRQNVKLKEITFKAKGKTRAKAHGADQGEAPQKAGGWRAAPGPTMKRSPMGRRRKPEHP